METEPMTLKKIEMVMVCLTHSIAMVLLEPLVQLVLPGQLVQLVQQAHKET